MISNFNKDNFFHNKNFINLIQENLVNCEIFKLNDELYYTIKKKYGIKILEILPFSLYSNFVLSDDNLMIQKYITQLEEHKCDIIRININPLFENKTNILKIFEQNLYKVDSYNASVLYIEDSLDNTRKKFNKSTKKHTNTTLKNERITVFQTSDIKYYEDYYEIYQDSLKRWGIKEYYSKQLLMSLSKINNIKLWVGLLDGKMVSGMIVFYSENGVFDWLAANYIREDISKNRVAVAVQYEVIRDAQRNNLKYVNMGASNNNEGVDFFKKRWGADYEIAYSFEKYSFRVKFILKILDEVKKIKEYNLMNYIFNKIGALVKKISNHYYDFKLIGDINIFNKDIEAKYSWSKTTQSIDYLYLKYSLQKFKIEPKDNVLDLGSGKGRILCYLNFYYKNIQIFGAEINKEATKISKELCKEKNISIYNTDALKDDFIVLNKINKIVLFNPFDDKTFLYFIDYINNNVDYYLEFIYINISEEQINILKKSKVKYTIDHIDKRILGINNKVNVIGCING